jgi:hypothetical protein
MPFAYTATRFAVVHRSLGVATGSVSLPWARSKLMKSALSYAV